MNAVKLATDETTAADAERLLITAYESAGEAKNVKHKTTIGPLIGNADVQLPSTTKPESFMGTQSIDNFDLIKK